MELKDFKIYFYNLTKNIKIWSSRTTSPNEVNGIYSAFIILYKRPSYDGIYYVKKSILEGEVIKYLLC